MLNRHESLVQKIRTKYLGISGGDCVGRIVQYRAGCLHDWQCYRGWFSKRENTCKTKHKHRNH